MKPHFLLKNTPFRNKSPMNQTTLSSKQKPSFLGKIYFFVVVCGYHSEEIRPPFDALVYGDIMLLA